VTYTSDVSNHQSSPSQELNKVPMVSIVLPLYNSENEVPTVLGELDKQSYPSREIVVVDDGSEDRTSERVAALINGRSDVRLLRSAHRGASHARNLGALQARGEIIFFSESDCVYDSAYLEKAVSSLESDPGAGAVCLTGAPLIKRSTLATRCIDIENKVQHRLLNEGKIQPFYAWVYRKDVFEKLGGFDERLFQGEDKDLFARLKAAGYGVEWVPGINWHHVRDQTTAELARKWFSRGKTRVLYSLKQRRWLEILKTLAPFWTLILGLAVLFWFPVVGVVLILLVVLAFLVQSAKTMFVSWPEVERKRAFWGYPLFLMVRNFSMALGYSKALGTIVVRKLRGRETSWNNL
jgi:glycosyltransferase AglI